MAIIAGEFLYHAEIITGEQTTLPLRAVNAAMRFMRRYEMPIWPHFEPHRLRRRWRRAERAEASALRAAGAK